jgi:hypothetical protein
MSNLLSLSLSLSRRKKKNYKLGPKLWKTPTTLERGSRMQQSTSTQREERERVGETRDRDLFLRTSEQKGCCCRTRSSSSGLQLHTWKNNRNKGLGHLLKNRRNRQRMGDRRQAIAWLFISPGSVSTWDFVLQLRSSSSSIHVYNNIRA